MNKQPSGTYRIGIKGLVQGVGFRPFVFRIATDQGLTGWVENRNDGVLIEVNASGKQLVRFREGILSHAPPAASIESLEVQKIKLKSFDSFEIRESRDISGSITEISPDIAVCPACLDDLKKQPHRLSYPLINCTHCGPRFSIIRDLPYDRPNTTMASFGMCPVCRSEYTDVHDRRFHAQPVACNICGPVYRLEYDGGATEDVEELLERSRELLSGDALLAVKGTGGFHLVCNAFSEDGISKLRRMKKRDGKPFALMFRNLEEARHYVHMGEAGEALLQSWRRPIVLHGKRRDITPGIADGLNTLGVMLPYMPFHHLLFERLDIPALVMTSGNFSEEPILISNEEMGRFSDHVDGFITYNREIFNRVDDSVTAVIRGKPMILRRARGYAPSPFRTGFDVEGILGTGAELTGSFCMGRGHLALMSPYTGDLKNLETLEFYRETYNRYCRLFRFTPELVVSDLHPDYLSTRFARQLAEQHPDMEHISVQHHHAHIASGMLDSGLEGEVLGFSFDGTGLGTDGHMWGAEVMRAGYTDFERLYHFEYMPLPGGDKAAEEPWRMGISYLHQCFGEELYDLHIPLIKRFNRKEIENMTALIQKGINTPRVSSAGRLFDAVAAIAGLNYFSTYQAEAPMLLESAIDQNEKDSYSYDIHKGCVSFVPLIKELVEDIHGGRKIAAIAAKFHNSLVRLILELSMEIRAGSGLDRIVLGGGTFQNRFLSEKVMDKLENEHFKVYLPQNMPVNDQGIAAGQLAIGAHRRKLM
ncbi:MAG: carbamoyltransferase HypF [Bacteroidota bacterium]|nr:carbamoyltransferase HypF [Bacteroidota bacterium]